MNNSVPALYIWEHTADLNPPYGRKITLSTHPKGEDAQTVSFYLPTGGLGRLKRVLAHNGIALFEE